MEGDDSRVFQAGKSGLIVRIPEDEPAVRDERCPEDPLLGGQFDGVVPHLTVAQGQDEALVEKAEADLLTTLPVVAQVLAVDLLVHGGTRWR
ncbi:hypothetical protein [Streptomyces sp. HD]|uniref:hypothetical protein n=1 Tax=Streptomyces sp. HD TaxID=3020892 RepID=UPI00232FFA8F|nr:hypothetical protein [Streptomyces sp. HD]MDC0771490.1 hypothetical protein [Streptomyces sp. HD]